MAGLSKLDESNPLDDRVDRTGGGGAGQNGGTVWKRSQDVRAANERSAANAQRTDNADRDQHRQGECAGELQRSGDGGRRFAAARAGGAEHREYWDAGSDRLGPAYGY